jgi:hypothetical protein
MKDKPSLSGTYLPTVERGGMETSMGKLLYAHELNAVTWEQCENLWLYGEFFADATYCHVRPPDRRFRLMVVAALRVVWCHLTDPRSQAAVEAAEQFADTQQPALLGAAEEGAERAYEEAGEPWDANNRAKCLAKRMAFAALKVLDPDLNDDPGVPFWVDTITGLESDEVPGRSREEAKALHLRLFHDIFVNPFHPRRSIDPRCLRWGDGTVVRIAEGIYEAKAFDRMGILADALLDAGCDDEAVLAHCREQEGVHSKGCWVLDLLLGKS